VKNTCRNVPGTGDLGVVVTGRYVARRSDVHLCRWSIDKSSADTSCGKTDQTKMLRLSTLRKRRETPLCRSGL